MLTGPASISLALTVKGIVCALIIATLFSEFSESVLADDRNVPTFEQYRATAVTIVKPALVNLASHAKARTYRTVLRDGAKTGPNFAGHYTIVTWGCGTACNEVGVVDARNGNVFFPRELQPLDHTLVTDGTPPLQYRIDSTLLVAAGSPMDREDNVGMHYYVWNGRSLRELLYVPKEWPR